jgi:alpha-tubulin suppressor-like RCC1 family protein
MLRKIACNATNSGAIDTEGNVYVWGAGKYGLLGNPKQKMPISKPIRLPLKSDNLTLDHGNEQTFVATNISFG